MTVFVESNMWFYERLINMSKSKKQFVKNNNNEAEEVVEEIYEGEEEFQDRFEKPYDTNWFTFKYAVLSAVIGLLAGVTGMLWIFSGGLNLLESVIVSSGDEKVVQQVEKVTVSFDERLGELVDTSKMSVVAFISAPETDIDVADTWPLDVIGWGMVLTNDGWLLTDPAVFKDRDAESLRVLTAQGDLLEILNSHSDWLEPLQYVRVASNDLLPVDLGDASLLLPGKSLLSVNPGLSRNTSRITLNHLEQVKWIDSHSLGDLVMSSEVYGTYLKSRDNWDSSLLGSPIFDLSGAVVGMLVSYGDSLHALPVEVISHANTSFFSSGQVVRTWLGADYIDLTQAIGLPDSITFDMTHGALIFGGEKEAVEEGSPAAQAGLQTNDIVLEIEGEIINGRYNLTEMIQSYPPGSGVTLLVLRDGKQIEVPVRLGELK